MFSTKAEYGVRVMAHLANSDDDGPISLGTIADAEGLPLAYPSTWCSACARRS